MRFIELIRIVWINIAENKFKVLLMALGIIVGAATIVMVIAIGQGGQDEITAQFDDLSVSAIYINASFGGSAAASGGQGTGGGMMMPPMGMGGGGFPGGGSSGRSGGGGVGAGSAGRNFSSFRLPQLTFENIQQIKDESPALETITLTASSTATTVIADTEDSLTVAAVTQDYQDIAKLDLLAGYFISDDDVEYEERIAVIGYSVCEEYFGNEQYAIGEQIYINNKKYTVVGVLDRKGDGIQNVAPDDSVFVPYTTGINDVFGSRMVMPSAIAVAKDVKYVDTAIAQIQTALEYIMDEGSENFAIEDAGSRVEAATESTRTMAVLLISVAGIVFIVSGIGIMNVMFVSVKERTREIGILKALGTSRSDILLQFLTESIFISAVGGLIGIGLSIAAMPLMRYTDIPVSDSLSGKLLALGFSVLTGTVFGFYPAQKASQLKPIDALNYE